MLELCVCVILVATPAVNAGARGGKVDKLDEKSMMV